MKGSDTLDMNFTRTESLTKNGRQMFIDFDSSIEMSRMVTSAVYIS